MAPAASTNPIRIDEALWARAMAPEAVLLLWTASDGSTVDRGARVAEILVEGARHQVTAPAAGRLIHDRQAASVLRPGDSIGHVDPL